MIVSSLSEVSGQYLRAETRVVRLLPRAVNVEGHLGLEIDGNRGYHGQEVISDGFPALVIHRSSAESSGVNRLDAFKFVRGTDGGNKTLQICILITYSREQAVVTSGGTTDARQYLSKYLSISHNISVSFETSDRSVRGD